MINWNYEKKKNALKNARAKQVLIVTILYGYLTAIHNDDDEVDKVESDYGVGQPSSSAIRTFDRRIHMHTYICMS